MAAVTTCVVVWIEIPVVYSSYTPYDVTTCVVVWIEIVMRSPAAPCSAVTTCVVVWIEIWRITQGTDRCPSHHLRGGVD